MFTLKRTDSGDKDFQDLIVLLDADLLERYGDQQAFFTPFNKTNTIKNVVVAYSDEQPIGCGAFRVDGDTVEIKRMYVSPTIRGKGLGHRILSELETWARETGHKEAILETGKNQPEAIRLYQKAGYGIIPNYEPYQNSELSICMKKLLG
ncbi:MAG: GNAT family N-acetyltransferase [Bacteroidota bacterium]